VEVADDRHVGKGARRRLVDRSQVVEVEDVGVTRPRRPQLALPSGDEPLVDLVVHPPEGAVRRTGAVLVGGVEGRVGAERILGGAGARVVDPVGVDAGEERPRVRRLAGCTE
jgi:hypothetical protein